MTSLRLCASVACALFVLAAPAGAATLTPTRFDDPAPGSCLPADCSLREAVLDAAAGDTVALSAGTYLVEGDNGELPVRRDLTLTGVGAGTVVDGQDETRILGVLDATLNLRALTLRRGLPPEDVSGEGPQGGSAIYVQDGRLVLDRATVRDSGSSETLSSAVFGGGIGAFDSQVILRDSAVVDNVSGSPCCVTSGGGIYARASVVRLERTTVADNVNAGNPFGSGGGIAVQGGSLTVLESVIRGNDASSGGGVLAQDAQVRIEDSRLTANGSGGSDGGAGAGLSQFGGRLTVSGSTFDANEVFGPDSGDGAAAAVFDAPFEFDDTTFSGNVGSEQPSGLSVGQASGFLREVTIVAPGGSALSVFRAGSTVRLRRALLAGACSVSDGATLTSQSGSLETGATCNAQVQNADPQLGALADNGGPTPTHALLAGSPAIDLDGQECSAGFPARNVDQRGVERPQEGDGTGAALCDAGAYELVRGSEIGVAVTGFAPQRVVTFALDAPQTLLSSAPVTGLERRELVRAITRDDDDTTLIAYSSSGRVLTLDPVSGTLTPRGSGPAPDSDVGLELSFDELVVTTATGARAFLDPQTGAGAFVRGPAYGPNDPNRRRTPELTGLTERTQPSSFTDFYALDTSANTLVREREATPGRLDTIGSLGVNTTTEAGFDLSPLDEAAFAVLTPSSPRRSALYAISLERGGATFVGPVGTGGRYTSFAVVRSP